MARDIVTGSLYSNTVESDQELPFGPRREKTYIRGSRSGKVNPVCSASDV